MDGPAVAPHGRFGEFAAVPGRAGAGGVGLVGCPGLFEDVEGREAALPPGAHGAGVGVEAVPQGGVGGVAGDGLFVEVVVLNRVMRRRGAAERGFTSFVQFLVERGADVQAKDANGRTALDLARGVGRKTPGDAVRILGTTLSGIGT